MTLKKLALITGLLGCALDERALAGGFELLGNGTEAIGRGTAFTAKADDGSALEYNIAGLARQRGTRLLVDGKLLLHTYEFSRAGNYPDANTPATPYGGQPFPKVGDTGGIFGTPLIAISTDFGVFDRWTFAIGLFAPNVADGLRSYPTTVGGAPAPQRYDLTEAHLVVLYPTLAAAARVTRWLDVGAALHLVYGNFQLGTVAFADFGRGLCATPETASCDSKLNIQTSGFTSTFALGALLHPAPWIDIGVHLRGPVYLNTSGQVTATSPAALPIVLDPSDATFKTRLPWVLRLGVRYLFRGEQGEEIGDIEMDGTYEAWNAAEGRGDPLHIAQLGVNSNIDATLVHNYHDTFSLRLGGAYNIFTRRGIITLRLGGYFDSAATGPSDTRLDFDTGAKWGATLGLGFHLRGVTFNAAYAYVYSPDRNVTNGRLQSINGIDGSNTTSDGQPLPVVNNGHYEAHTQVFALGLSFHFDEMLRKRRVLHYY
jgi:long-subunit fatty acid transport protein